MNLNVSSASQEGTTTAEKLQASEISLVNLWGGPNNDQHLDVLLASGVIRTLKPLEKHSGGNSSSDRAAECRRWCRAIEQLIHNPVGTDSDDEERLDGDDDDDDAKPIVGVQSQQRSLNSLIHNSSSGTTKSSSSPMSYSTSVTENSSRINNNNNKSGDIVNVVLRKGGQTVDSSMMHATVPTTANFTSNVISKSLLR